MKEFKIVKQEARGYFLRFGKCGECFTGWCVCVLTSGCISFFGDYGDYQMRGISPNDIESLKQWIIGTAENNLDYVMSKTNHKKRLVDCETLEANFRKFLKDYEIELTEKQWEEAQEKLEEYEEWPNDKTAFELFEIATSDAWEMETWWHDWDASVKAFYNEQYKAFAAFFKEQLLQQDEAS